MFKLEIGRMKSDIVWKSYIIAHLPSIFNETNTNYLQMFVELYVGR